MERKITKLESCHVQVDVKVDTASWKEAQEKAMKKAIANVEVKGFRKGQAPEAVAKKHIDQMKVMDDAINSLLPKIYEEIIKEDKVAPFAQPKVDVTKISDTDLEIKFVIVTGPEIKLGAYKDLSIGKKEVKVGKAEVNAAIEEARKQNASLVVKEGAAAKGDTVIMDFEGKVDGKAFEGGSSKNYELELGSNSFIPGFEDQLVGVKAGEHKDVNVTFPEQYTKELAGKAAVFGCDVHEVKAKKLPELNDEFVKDLNIKDVDTVAKLEQYKLAELTEQKEKEARNEYLTKLYEKIAKDSKIEIPSEMIEDQAENRKRDMEQRMSQSGLTLEQYLTFVGQKEEEFMAKLKEDSKRDITNYFILEEVSKAENMEITDADVEFEISKLADQYKMKIEDVRKALGAQLGEFKNNLKMTRVEQFLFTHNN
ncbi:MAG: trigger factor [Bacilli bacterium]|nr:trigger factor [Bacilli bacterium]